MEHAAAVRISDGVADIGEPVEQLPQLECASRELRRDSGVSSMIVPNRLVQAGSLHKPHGIKRPAVVVDAQGVDRHDSRMLESAGDLGLEQEPIAAVGVVGAFGLDLLQGHLALKLGVEGHRDLADASLRVQAQHVKPHARGCGCARLHPPSACESCSGSGGMLGSASANESSLRWPAADSEDVAPDPGPVSPRLTIDATVGFVLKPASRLPFLVRSHATSVALCRQELKIGCRLEPLTCDIRKFGPSHHSDKSNRLEWPEFTAFPIRSIVATRFGAGHG